MSLNNLFNKKIIFFGDSITDANRLLNPKYPNGFGYVSMINDDYAINHSYANITILNRGISGNKTNDLLDRINDVLNQFEIEYCSAVTLTGKKLIKEDYTKRICKK